MSTVALRKYDLPAADTLDKFHGAQLVYIGWDQHLLFCAPFAFPLPPDMPFGALVEKVIPGAFGYHPDLAKVDWKTVTWLKGGQPFTPDFGTSLAANGVRHKDALRFRTPGLRGVKDSCS